MTSDTSPANVFEMIDQTRATWTFMVPTMWASMVTSEEMDRFDLGSLRLLLSGGSPLLTHTKEAILRQISKGWPQRILWRHRSRPGDESRSGGPAAQGSIRWPASDRNVRRAARRTGKPGSARQVGEIHIGGATIIREYFNNPEATASARRGGFFTLGDMGRFDEEGHLYIVDRKKDMIISGGENIFPNDIEEILYRHPAVEWPPWLALPIRSGAKSSSRPSN